MLSAALFDNTAMGKAYLAGVLADDATALDWIENSPGAQLVYASDESDDSAIKTAKTAMKAMLDAAGLGAAGLLLRLNNALGTSFTDLGSLFTDASASAGVVSDAALFALVAASAANRAYLLYDAPWAAALDDVTVLTRYLDNANTLPLIAADEDKANDVWALALADATLMTKLLTKSDFVNKIFADTTKIGALLATREYRAMIEASSLAVTKMNSYGTVATKAVSATYQAVGSGLIWVAGSSCGGSVTSAGSGSQIVTYLTNMEYSPAATLVSSATKEASPTGTYFSGTSLVCKFASDAQGVYYGNNVYSVSSTITYRTW
jgi:hypothetical protein